MKNENLKQDGYGLSLKISHVLREEHTKTKKAYGLLDTGASITVVDFKIIKYLQLQSNINKSAIPVITPFNDGLENFRCPLKITFTNQNKETSININALCIPDKTLKTGRFDVIIGRDILKYFIFNWNGPDNKITINSIKNPIDVRA